MQVSCVSMIKTFIVLLMGVLLAPALADGINTATSNVNITATASATILGLVLTIYAILIVYAGAKTLGAI